MLTSETHVIFFLIIISLTSLSGHILTKRNSEATSDLPECSLESSCGYIQLNGRGINSMQTCRCRGQTVCPLTWDPYDGQTIVHGSDQYKYCGPAPMLDSCQKNQLAYSTKLDMSMMTMKTIISDYRLHCNCRGNWMLSRNSSTFQEVDEDVSQLTTTYICTPPPRCAVGAPCMGVTESSESSFVTRMCRCPRGTACPKDIRMASQRVDTKNGAYFTMECQ